MTIHDCERPVDPTEDDPDEWACPVCGMGWEKRIEASHGRLLRGVVPASGWHVTDRTRELQEAIDSADYEGFTTLGEAAADELMRLWGDLHHQMRDARDGCWSVGCESVAHRIAVLTRAVGKATPWQEVQIELLETGVYQRMHDLMGVPYDPPDMDMIAKMRADRETGLVELRGTGR